MPRENNGETLREPMLECLKRVTEELAEKLEELNKLVKEKTGKDLKLEILSVVQHAADDYRIKVRGIAFTSKTTEEEFQVKWMSDTCPSSIHLLQWRMVAFGRGRNFIYCGVVDATSEALAKEIAIYTHHMQIPGVLSR